MDGVQHSFLDLGYRRLSWRWAVNDKYCECAQSGHCHVWCLLGVVRSSDHIPTNALEVSCSGCNVLTDTKEKLDCNNTSVQPTIVANVTV